jgi:hypothetical protein
MKDQNQASKQGMAHTNQAGLIYTATSRGPIAEYARYHQIQSQPKQPGRQSQAGIKDQNQASNQDRLLISPDYNNCHLIAHTQAGLICTAANTEPMTE